MERLGSDPAAAQLSAKVLAAALGVAEDDGAAAIGDASQDRCKGTVPLLLAAYLRTGRAHCEGRTVKGAV